MKQIEMLLTDSINIQCNSLNQEDISFIEGVNISVPTFFDNEIINGKEMWNFDAYVSYEVYMDILNKGNKLFSTTIDMINGIRKEFQLHIRQAKVDFVEKIGLYTVRFYDITGLDYSRMVYRDGHSIQIG